MRPRPILEMLVVLGVVGLVLEIAGTHTWVVAALGAAAACWLLSHAR